MALFGGVIGHKSILENTRSNRYEYEDALLQSEDADQLIKNEVEDIDNSELTYDNRGIHIRLNNKLNFFEKRKYQLDRSAKNLAAQFPAIGELLEQKEDSTAMVEHIVRKEFPDGFLKTVYVRNLSYIYIDKKGEEQEDRILGIRPMRLPGGSIDNFLPEKYSLIFKGHIDKKEYVVDSIEATYDSEQLQFEVECSVICYDDPERIRHCFLYDLAKESGSITKYTRAKLELWREYIDWKNQLIQKKIHGCKYIKIDCDIEKSKLYFWLLCKDEEDFSKFKRYLRKDEMQVYENAYSSDLWDFKYNDTSNTKQHRKRGVGLGRYRGIIEEGYKENLDEIEPDYEERYNNEYDENSNNNYSNQEEKDNEPATNALLESFSRNYIAKVVFDLNEEDQELVKDIDMDNSDMVEYAKKQILDNYDSHGFLALTALGSLILNKRLRDAINNLANDTRCASPNLALWLFDITKARKPKEESVGIDKWLNSDIANNEHQRAAVEKMLVAPDVCIIQGPPGTGKTTVIAEAIYQFVRQGKRVLITSQSNDAVDNALERLILSPEIRAIRLGRKGKLKHTKKEEYILENKYSENLALKCFYHSISYQLSTNWLKRWDELDEREDSCRLDFRNVTVLNVRLKEERDNVAQCQAGCERYKEQQNEINRLLDDIKTFNNELSWKKLQFNHFKRVVCEGEDLDYTLDEDQKQSLFKTLNELLKKYQDYGIFITRGTILDSDRVSDSILTSYIGIIIKGMDALHSIYIKLTNIGDGSQNSQENSVLIAELEYKIQSIGEKMDAIDDGDDDTLMDLLKEQREVKKALNKAKESSNSIELSINETAILSDALQKGITDIENNSHIVNFIKDALETYKSCIENTIASMENNLNSIAIRDEKSLENKAKEAIGKYEYAKEILNAHQNNWNSLQKEMSDIAARYSGSVDDVATAIQETLDGIIRNKIADRTVRDVWELTIRKFDSMLIDDEKYNNEKNYYQKTYINACNVVGISCTDNMRDLIDHGFDNFDVVIIDEVSKATPPEMLIPLLLANKAVLVGDHRQLPPMFDEHERSYKEVIAEQKDNPEENEFRFIEQDFHKYEKMITSSMFKDYFEHADDSMRQPLLTQYRMHSDIMEIINRFYENCLENGLSKDVEKHTKNHDLTLTDADNIPFIVPQKHAYWLDSSALPDGKPMYEVYKGASTSACNILEAFMIIELLRKIAIQYTSKGYTKKNRKTVGIISFYQRQVNDIRKMFRGIRKDPIFNAIDVDINTVDRFQGKEKNIIITSLVRNNESGRASKHIVAFERINVAFSRAQELLIIVGAKHLYNNQDVELPGMFDIHITTTPIYKNIIDGLRSNGCYIDSGKLVTKELREKILAEYESVRTENANR